MDFPMAKRARDAVTMSNDAANQRHGATDCGNMHIPNGLLT
jgi:hypothetical protein